MLNRHCAFLAVALLNECIACMRQFGSSRRDWSTEVGSSLPICVADLRCRTTCARRSQTTARSKSTAECNQFCHPVQSYAATECNVKLPPGVQNIIRADGVPRLRFDQDDVQKSKVRFAD